MYVQEIEEKVLMLENENAKLHNTIKELTAKLEEPHQQQSAENYRLMKEVEELNAKLGMNT
jgi:predicted RNA-binding protein with RPS1 domain